MRHTIAPSVLLWTRGSGLMTTFLTTLLLSLRRAPVRLAIAALAVAFGAAESASAQDTAACWTPAELAHRPGEEKIQKKIKNASIAPPQRALASYSPAPQRGIVRRVKLPAGKKLIALTFDLCEQPSEIAGYQGGIVDYLRANRIKATFFVGGKWMLSHRDRAQQLIADGLFEVANHAWAHRNLRNLSGRALTDEVRNVQLAYEQVRDDLAAKQCIGMDGRTPAAQQAPRRLGLFRFPFGACSPEALAEVAAQGLLPIQWDVSSGDPAVGLPATTMTQNVLASVRPGSIVLFHANGRGWSTEAALPGIVTALRAKGYEFATVTELLAAGEPVMSETCYDSRPGDTDQPRSPRPPAISSWFGPFVSPDAPTGSIRSPSRSWPSFLTAPRPQVR
jgi:peptidoglycan/xylan/chitin deacetylase (PgdA/CDA1 family)